MTQPTKQNTPFALVLSFVLVIAFAISSGLLYMNQTLQPEPVYRFDPVLEKLNQPVGFAHLDDERMFVLERNGVIHVLDKGRLLDQPFLDISDRVNIEGNIEQGILGIAFHPNIAENRYFYVTYTDADYTVHLSRFLLTDDPNIADSSSEEILISVEQTTAAHNGGHIEFGPDGYMYVSIGDGGESIDPRSTGQRTNDLLGKMLRLDVSDESQLYTIPEDNPFVDNPDYRPEIWARGLRNPWIFSFVPDSDAMFIGDVGWSTYEEINYQPAGSTGGENYGWKLYEAEAKIEQTEGTVYEDIPAEDLVFPIYYYPHATPEDYDESFPVGCAVIGGFVYRGEELPALQGKYLYSDFCHGDLWTLHQVGNQWVTERILETDLMVTALGENIHGEVYLATFLGEVRRLILDSNDNAQPEGDLDYDLVANQDDNCPEVGNPDQQDNWGDLGVGDAYDTNVYLTNANDYEVYVYQQHYGAYHIYGCEGLGCGFVASIEISNLSPDTKLTIESETFTGWMIEAKYSSDFDGSSVYDVRVYDADGNVYIDNLQILINGDMFSWRTIS